MWLRVWLHAAHELHPEPSELTATADEAKKAKLQTSSFRNTCMFRLKHDVLRSPVLDLAFAQVVVAAGDSDGRVRSGHSQPLYKKRE